MQGGTKAKSLVVSVNLRTYLPICHKGNPRIEKVGQDVEDPANGPESQEDPTAGK